MDRNARRRVARRGVDQQRGLSSPRRPYCASATGWSPKRGTRPTCCRCCSRSAPSPRP